MRVDNNNNLNQMSMEVMDPEARAAVIAIKDGQQMKQEGQKLLRQAQNDQITQMKKSAHKLREMADMGWAQGITNAVASVVGAVAQGAGGSSMGAEGQSAVTGINTVVQAVQKLDPFGHIKEEMNAEKAEIDIKAKVAGQHASNASEDLQHGQRAQEKMTNLMEKVLDARHRARAAAIKA